MGSLLVCDWLHSVGQNHFFVMMHLNRDSAIQRLLVFWPHSVFGQNHLCVKML
jgi:hypothetical protein